MSTQPLWTIEQIAKHLSVHVRTVRRMRTDDPAFPRAIRFNQRTVRYEPSEVLEWVRRRQAPPAVRPAASPPNEDIDVRLPCPATADQEVVRVRVSTVGSLGDKRCG